MTNLPRMSRRSSAVRPIGVAGSIEGHFQILTELLHCEIPSLGYRERRCSPSGYRRWPATRWRC